MRTSPEQVANDGGESPFAFAVKAVDRFFFTPMDPTSLGLMRIVTGILLFYVHLVLCNGLTDYLGPNAWVVNTAWSDKPGESGVTDFIRHGNPMQSPSSNWRDGWGESNGEVIRGQAMWSIYFHVEDPRWVWVIHIAILIVMLLFTLGLWTRVTGVLMWIGSMQYIQRFAGTMLFGMDTMTNLGLFYLMLAPCGAALSLDRWLEIRRERRRLGDRYVPQPPPPLVSAGFVTRLIQINFCLIYVAAGTSKLLGTSWWNGTAPNRFLLNYSFAPFDVPQYVSLIKYMAAHRWMWEVFCAVGVIFTLSLELGFSFLVWNRRTRWVMVSMSVVFHTMIALLMGLVTFSLMMLCLVLAFVPPDAVRHSVASVGEQLRRLLNSRGQARTQPVALSR